MDSFGGWPWSEGYWDAELGGPVGQGGDGWTAGGWFRTGDAATVDQHGWLTVVDRLKDVVITGGENVFSVEVEDVLRQHPRVDKAAVCRARSITPDTK